VVASIVALAVSAGVIVVALAFALYAGVKPYVGQAAAAAVVAGAAAILIGVLGLILGVVSKPPKRRHSHAENLIDRIADFVREKPVVSVGGALAAGLLAVLNPKYLGVLVRSFVEGREPPRRRR
jgi:hypothetical protein